MQTGLPGIHHVTAIAGDPQRNVDFYAGMLGLRLVKRTVNFDDPTTYHLYYGDEVGHPGTILTFFPWPGARRGRQGTGQVAAISLSIPRSSLGSWLARLVEHGVRHDGPSRRFEEHVLAFRDPDGLALELVGGSAADDRLGWGSGPVPAEHAIRGVFGVTLLEDGYELSAQLLTETMGFRSLRAEGNRFRYVGDSGSRGAVHHVAWRTPDDEQQRRWREKLAGTGLNVSPVLDRQYFRTIYFREPGGVLFEIATDPPGFTIDEAADELGGRLRLPPWLEPVRPRLEEALPALHAPSPRREAR